MNSLITTENVHFAAPLWSIHTWNFFFMDLSLSLARVFSVEATFQVKIGERPITAITTLQINGIENKQVGYGHHIQQRKDFIFFSS